MKITLVPFAGLGNRLNAISSAIALRNTIGCDIAVFWESNADCQCQFTDLFLPIDDIPVLPLDKFYLIRRGKRFLGLPMLLRRFIFDGCFKAREIWNSDFLLQSDCSYQNIYVATCMMSGLIIIEANRSGRTQWTLQRQGILAQLPQGQ